jgi:hypothetical protein
MSDQTSKPEKLDEITKRLQHWLATPEGAEALRDVLDRIFKTAADLQDERELDAQAVERPVTL